MRFKKLFAGVAAAATLLGGMALGAGTAVAADATTKGTTITVNVADGNALVGRKLKSVKLASYGEGDSPSLVTVTGEVGDAIADAATKAGYTANDGDVMTWVSNNLYEDNAAAASPYAGKLRDFVSTLAAEDAVVNAPEAAKGQAMGGGPDGGSWTFGFGADGAGLYLVTDVTADLQAGYANAIPMLVGTAWTKADGTPVVPNATGVVELKGQADLVAGTDLAEYVDRRDHAINDDATFTITSKIPNYIGYPTQDYVYTLVSAYPGLQLTSNEDVKVTITKKDGTVITPTVGSTNKDVYYTFTPGLYNGKFTLQFGRWLAENAGRTADGNNYTDGLSDPSFVGATVTVTFKATVTKSTGTNGLKSTATLTYSADPVDATKTKEISTYEKVFNFDYSIHKVDDNDTNKMLQGAKFSVVKTDDFVSRDAPDWNLTTKPLDQPQNIGEFTTGEDGHLTISGIDAGIYKITETQAPAGYLNSKLSFTVTVYGSYEAEPHGNDGLTSAPTDPTKDPSIEVKSATGNFEVGGADTTGLGLVDARPNSSYDYVRVRNVTSITQLPLTGGAGIALFSVIAVALLGAGAFGAVRMRRQVGVGRSVRA